MYDCVLSLLACVIIWHDKEPIPEEELNIPNDPTPDGEHLSEDEGRSHWTFLIILLLYVWLSLVEPS
jgi:hypothetical protein